jgi:hypothetical protein
MALDTNIALGVKPIEQPNMLAQMGQMMQLRAAQQGYESDNALRDFYAQGGNASTAEGQRQLMSKVGLKGLDVIGRQSEISARDIKTQTDSLKTIKDNIGLANNPQAMAEYLRGAYNTPGGALLAKLVPLDKALASIPNDPKAFADFQRNFGLTTDKLFTSAADQLQAQVTREGHGVQMYGHNVSAANSQRTDTRERSKLHFLTGDNGFYGVNQYNATATPVGMAPPPPAAQPPVTNALANPATASTIVNAPVNSLLPTVQSQPGAPTVANAPTTLLRPPAKNIQTTEITDPDNPMQSLRVNANTYTGKGVNDPGYIGVVKTGNLNPVQQQKLKTEMAKDYKTVENAMAQTDEILKSIDAVRNSDLKAISGPVAGRLPTAKDNSLLAETRLDNLKGKVTALGKASSTMSGAIGSIATQEWKILADQIAVIDLTKGEKSINEQIDRVEEQAIATANRMRDGFERQYGEHIDNLAPQYKEIPNVKYKMGSSGFNISGQQTPSGSGNVDSNNKFLK